MLIIYFSICLIVGLYVWLSYHIKKKYLNFILENSITLAEVKKINTQYHFYVLVSYDERHTYDNEKFYEAISCADYLIYQLQFTKTKIITEINKAKYNRNHIETYYQEIKKIEHFGYFRREIGKLKKDKLIKMEKELFNKMILRPETLYKVKIQLILTKMSGQFVKRKEQIFLANQIEIFIHDLNQKEGNFFLNKSIWDAICRVERGKVTNKMRFFIYNRDGYRCRRCGKRGDFNNLEIDHILPISKGGKSIVGNLQTLCESCNKLKGTKVIRY